jgi:hypothetical protein
MDRSKSFVFEIGRPSLLRAVGQPLPASLCPKLRRPASSGSPVLSVRWTPAAMLSANNSR